MLPPGSRGYVKDWAYAAAPRLQWLKLGAECFLQVVQAS